MIIKLITKLIPSAYKGIRCAIKRRKARKLQAWLDNYETTAQQYHAERLEMVRGNPKPTHILDDIETK